MFDMMWGRPGAGGPQLWLELVQCFTRYRACEDRLSAEILQLFYREIIVSRREEKIDLFAHNVLQCDTKCWKVSPL